MFGFTSATTAGKTDNVVEKLINNDSKYIQDFLIISKWNFHPFTEFIDSLEVACIQNNGENFDE